MIYLERYELPIALLLLVIGAGTLLFVRRTGTRRAASPQSTASNKEVFDPSIAVAPAPQTASRVPTMNAEVDLPNVLMAPPSDLQSGPMPESLSDGQASLETLDAVGERTIAPETSRGEQLSGEIETDSPEGDHNRAPLEDVSGSASALTSSLGAGSLDASPMAIQRSVPAIGGAQSPQGLDEHDDDEGSPITASSEEPAAASLADSEPVTTEAPVIESIDVTALLPVDAGLDEENNPEDEEPASDSETTPRQYRPAPRLPRPARPRPSKISDPNARERSLRVAARLWFRAGICQFSLLAQRRSDLPEQIEVHGNGRTDVLRALQDDWYELRAPDDLSGLLSDGASWTSRRPEEVTAKWTFPQRDVHVLGVVAGFGGYVSISRLIIGEEHVVLCAADRRLDALAALAAAGCVDFEVVDQENGLPDRWTAFKNVRPSRSVPTTNDGDILDTLRPLAAIDIQLEGGIQLDRSAWLVGHAPRIRFRGDLSAAGTVLIDNQAVLINDQGVCESANQGSVGEHTVWSPSTSRRYRVVEGKEEWTAWSAHHAVNGAICGGAVFPLPESRQTVRQTVVRAGNVSLIGALPGTVLHCFPDAASRSAGSVVFPSFEPVWVIPRFPLRCNKATARITRVGTASPSSGSISATTKRDRNSQMEWSRIVLDADRRKLIREPADEATVDLWEDYERTARSIWRRLR